MTTGWQCARCGTLFGLLMPSSPRFPERRAQFLRCFAEKCPTTLRGLLWRVFGRRLGGRPVGWKERLRSLPHGDFWFLKDNEYLRTLRDRGEWTP